MSIKIPFPSALNVPLPRRFVILGLSAAVLILFLHTFAPRTLPPVLTPHIPHHEPDASYFSPSKWLPPIFNPSAPDRPPEFDEDGACLFLSPFGALSTAEKERAAALTFEEVSAGIVRSRYDAGTLDLDLDLDLEAGLSSGNSTETDATRGGVTHPILGLLRDGERKWNDLVAGQSHSLEQAVQVYKERWNRAPPKGFDLWYVVPMRDV